MLASAFRGGAFLTSSQEQPSRTFAGRKPCSTRATASESGSRAREPHTTRIFTFMKLYWPNSDMPHGYLCDTPIHLVYRLSGCLPVGILKELTAELVEQLTTLQKHSPQSKDQIEKVKEEYFLQYDSLLDAQDQSRYILIDPDALQIVLESWKILHANGDCHVHAVCIMGNHVHVILSAWPGQPEEKLGPLIARHKRFTDRMLKRGGYSPPKNESNIWAKGFFDRYIRIGTYEVVLDYLINNPTKAGLIDDPRRWPGLWIP